MRSSFATRGNLDLIDEKYRRWERDPDSVDATWRAFFEGFELGNTPQRNGAAAALPAPRRRRLKARSRRGSMGWFTPIAPSGTRSRG